MTEMDPFTFYANFTRGVTAENRRKIIASIKEELSLASPVPSDFDGLPVANIQSAWFVAYATKRSPTDVPTLWEVAKAAVSFGPREFPPELFTNALAIRRVAIAKLTMGLFWIRPEAYLPLDNRTREYLRAKEISATKVADLQDYLEVLDAVERRLGNDFKQISLDAYHHDPDTTKRYWVGGFGEKERLERMLAGSFWEHGWSPETTETAGQLAWKLFDQIQPGDELAIKGYGGRSDLKV
jgi:hypothetical protein